MELTVTDPVPKLEFSAPILWKATQLLRDAEGNEYAVATAIDPIRQQELFVSGNSGEWVPFRRLLCTTQNGWELVQDKDVQHTALRLTEEK